MRPICALAVALLLSFPLAAQKASAPASSTKPKVRAITGFVRLDRATWEKQIAEALVLLRKTQKEFESAEETRRLAGILRAGFVKIAPANP